MKLREKLFFCSFVPAALALLISGFFSYIIVSKYFYDHEKEQLTINAKNFAEQISPYILPVLRQPQATELTQAFALLGDFRIRLFDDKWRLLAESNQNKGRISEYPAISRIESTKAFSPSSLEGMLSSINTNGIVWHISRSSVAKADTFSFRYICSLSQDVRNQFSLDGLKGTMNGALQSDTLSSTDENDNEFRVRTYSGVKNSVIAEIDGSTKTVGYIELSHLKNHVLDNLIFFLKAIIIAAVIALFAAFILCILTGKAILLPINGLCAQSTKMAGGDFSIYSTTRNNSVTELIELSHGFNFMATQIQAMLNKRDSEQQALRIFFDNAAHEMRTPLSAVSNYIELLQGAAANDVFARTRFLAACGEQIEKLEKMNKALLELARIDSSVTPFSFRNQMVIEVLHDAIAVQELSIARKSIRISISVIDNAVCVYGDRDWLVIAISNLIDNAVKYSDAGKEIELGAKTMSDGNWTAVWIKDQGIGITDEQQEHIFDRFYRGRRIEPGFGLGLSMVRSIVLRHSGEIFLESKVDYGSTFTLILPAKKYEVDP